MTDPRTLAEPDAVYGVIRWAGIWHVFGGAESGLPGSAYKSACGRRAPRDAEDGLYTRGELARRCRRCPW